MRRLGKMLEAVFAAVAFAEQGEWDEAARFADGPPPAGKQPRRRLENRRKERRPRKRV